jgi:hypothetical protein
MVNRVSTKIGPDGKRLPAGIWWDAKKNRYRVRLYKNRVSHLCGYFKTFHQATKALQELKVRLSHIPAVRRRKRMRVGQYNTAPTHEATLGGLARSIREHQLIDPLVMQRKEL